MFMSINMTQGLMFDTDDLASFEKMLSVAVRVLFGENGKYVTLHIHKKKPFLWPDGKGSGWAEVPEVLEDKGKWFHLCGDGIYGGAPFVKKGEEFANKDKAAAAASKQYKEPPPVRMWIATLSDYSGDFERLAPDERYHCPDHNFMVETAMDIVRDADSKKFFEMCGDGYHYGFNHFDGSIGVGYRMEWSPNGGWNLLHLMMVHAYYGK
jgi:hypothetical protein